MPADGRPARLDASRRRHRAGAAGGRTTALLRALRRARSPLTALAVLGALVAVVVSSPPPDGPTRSTDLLLASFQDPAPPASVSLTVLDGRLAASWPASSESSVLGYRVTATAGSTTKDFGEQQSPYTLTGLANGTAWTVRVRTVTYDNGLIGLGAQGPFTGTQAATATATPVALPPTDLAMASADRQLTLSWNAPADSTVNGYQVWSGGTQIATTNASTRSYTRTGLVNGVTYTATVRATYSSGAVSGDSAAASGVPRDAVAPAAPTGLVATRGDGRVALSWTANAEYDVSGYRVLRDGTAVGTTAAGTRSYTDTGLTNDTTYSYALQALDTSGNTSQTSSPAVSATPTDLTPPAVPTGLAATSGDGAVSLGWTANRETDLASYRVLRGGTAVATVAAPGTSWRDSGLTNGTAYQYALQAVDTHGNASAASSPAVSATPADTTPPAVPTGLAAVRGDGQVVLTWTAGTEADLDGYDLFRDRVRVQGAVLGAGATTFTDTGLTNDVTYTYALRARDRDGNTSASSAGVSATPTDLTPPAVPARPSAVAGDTVVSLSWAPSSETDLASYQVLRDGTAIATVTKPTTTYDDRSVTNGTTYAYTLKALDTHGNASAATAPAVTATPRDLTPPAVPTGLSATRGDGQVVLSWTAGSEPDLALYRVLRGGTVVATVTAPATSYTDTGLTNDTAYLYALSAVDGSGNGSPASSPEVSATPTDLTPPAAPSGVTSTAGDGVVDVAWQANTEPDLASYRVYRDGQLVATVGVVAPPGTTPTSYRDTGLANGTARTYAVTAVDTHGNESPTSATGATPVDTTPPGGASGLAAAPSDRQVALTWTASPSGDVATYRVLRDGVEVGTVPAGTTSFTDTGLANGRAYSYTVVAVDAAGNRSLASGSTTTTTPRDAVAPAAPTAVSATPGSGSATVRWTAPADTDLAGYRVVRADGSVAVAVAAPATSATVTGLANGTPVSFTVVVVDTSGNASSASASVTVTPAATSVPAQGAGQSGALAVSADGRWLVVATAAALDPADTNGTTELYRVDTTGQVPPRRVAPIAAGGPTAVLNSSDAALSADGRYVVVSTTVALSSRDTNQALDVYRGDLSTTPTTWALVSVPSTGRTSSVAGTVLQPGSAVYATSPGVAVSADGSRVLFYSARDDLVTGDGNGAVDVFAKDLSGADPGLGPVARVSTGAGGGALPSSRTALGPALALTPDGRFAVFTATSSSGPLVVLRKDLGTATGSPASAAGAVLVVSSTAATTASGGSQVAVGAYRDTGDVAISDDGRFVAFVSASKLATSTPLATASTGLAYRKDLQTGAVVALGSGQTTEWEHQVGLSPDGAFGTFSTTAGLTASDTNGHTDVYGRDLASGGPLVLVTAGTAGAAVPSPSAPVSSAEYGRTRVLGGGAVVVVTVQPLLPGDTNGTRDVYRKDLDTGAVTALVAT